MRLLVQLWALVSGPLVSAVLLAEPLGAPPPGAGANADRLITEADSLASARRYEDAAPRYAAALELRPDSLAVAKRALGVFWRAGRDDHAYVWGRRVLGREPRSVDALFDLGVTCGFLVDLGCIDSVFHRTIELDSTFVDGYCELGFLAQARGRMTEAIRWMEAAVAVAPHDDFAVSGLAQMLIPAGQAARARGLMEPCLAASRSARAYGGRSYRERAATRAMRRRVGLPAAGE